MTSKRNIQFEQPSELLVLGNRYLIVIIAVVVFAILMLGYFFLLKPKINTNNNLQIELSKVQNNQQTSQHLLDSLEKLKEQYENIQNLRQADLDRLRQIIPTNPQIAELFVVANKLAANKGFRLNNISIVDSQDKELAVTPANKNTNPLDDEGQSVGVNKTTTKVQPDSVFKNLTLQLSITKMSAQELALVNPNLATEIVMENKSNYQLFKEYLVALEENLRLFDIQTIAFSSIAESTLGQNPADLTLPSFTFSIVTYYR